MATRGETGMQRIVAKLHHKLSNGEYYEAHQLYRTLYFRYTSQQKYNEAIELLADGSEKLFKAGQLSSGADLALLLVNTMEKANAPVDDKNIERLSLLHRMISNEQVERHTFVVTAIRWSRMVCSSGSAASVQPCTPSSGHPMLHAQFAATYWHEADYNQARYHYVRSADGESCASMLIEYHILHGFPTEVDLFIAQAVFQYLCLRNKVTAEACFNRYTQQHPQVESGPPFVRPLLNFIWMLLLAIDGGNLAVFTVLCEQYQITLQRDPSYNDYLLKIGQLFFNVSPPRSSQGLFGNILSSFLTLDDDMSDDGSDDQVLSVPTALHQVELD